MHNLKQLPSNKLVNEILTIRTTERETVAEIIRYLEEIDSRQYYRELGYSSLFTFCTKYLGYSESSAQRRISSARAYRVDERVYQLLKVGEVTITTVSLIYKELVKSQDKSLLTKIIGKSKFQVEQLLWESLAPSKPSVRKSTVRKIKRKVRVKDQRDPLFKSLPLAEEQDTESVNTASDEQSETEVEYSLTLKVDQEFIDLLAEVKELSGKAEFDDVNSLKRAMKGYIEQHSPIERQKRRIKRKVKQSKPTKAIPAFVKDQVYIRDGGRCSYVAKDGTRCSCRTALEYDHILPRAIGGDNCKDNIRLLCRAHNLLMAEHYFGREYIKKVSGAVGKQPSQHLKLDQIMLGS